MRWQNRKESSNIEDRRGRPGGGLRGRPSIYLLLIVMVAGYYGIDLTPLLSGMPGESTSISQPYTQSASEQEAARFTSVVLKTTEDTWQDIFRSSGKRYEAPRLVLYTGGTQTACGYGQAVAGPFYCPADQTVYLDLNFYNELESRHGGGGDFAQGYVLAHEVGHHVQHLLGIDRQVRQAQQGLSQTAANKLSVQMELQADCYAGVWGHAMYREGILEAGDLEEALRTAAAIGDDTLQRQSAGAVMPDKFTHGTARQRHDWFKRGFDSGNPAMCNTF